MPEIKISLETILLAVGILLLVMQNISILNKGRKDWRELSGATARENEMRELTGRVSSLENDVGEIKGRLDKGESNFAKISSDTAQIMDVLDGLLMHFISGNDREKLRSVKSDLDEYKNKRLRDE